MALAKLDRINPQAGLSNLWRAKHRRPDDLARLKEGLRIAGMFE